MSNIVPLFDKNKDNIIKKRYKKLKRLLNEGIFVHSTGETRLALHEDIFYILMYNLDKEERLKEFSYISDSRVSKFGVFGIYTESQYYECSRYIDEKYKISKGAFYNCFTRTEKVNEYLKFFDFHMLKKSKTVTVTDSEGIEEEVSFSSKRMVYMLYIGLLPHKERCIEYEIFDLHRTSQLTDSDYDKRIEDLFKRYDLKKKFEKYNEKMTNDTLADMLKL